MFEGLEEKNYFNFRSKHTGGHRVLIDQSKKSTTKELTNMKFERTQVWVGFMRVYGSQKKFCKPRGFPLKRIAWSCSVRCNSFFVFLLLLWSIRVRKQEQIKGLTFSSFLFAGFFFWGSFLTHRETPKYCFAGSTGTKNQVCLDFSYVLVSFSIFLFLSFPKTNFIKGCLKEKWRTW